MNIFMKGDIHGWNRFSSPSVRGHHRPAHHDFGSIVLQPHVRLDNVESNVGTGNDTSNICGIQLPFSKNQGKE